MYILVFFGSWAGGYVATALGAPIFSGLWFLLSFVGLVGGIYVFIKMGQWGQ